MGRMSLSSCSCCMCLSCVYYVAVINAVFCMTCSLLMLVEDARGDHVEEAYSSASLMNVSVSCLPHPVAVSVFIIWRGLCACTEMWAVCFLSTVRPRTFGCLSWTMLFISKSRFLLFSAWSGVNIRQVVLPGFNVRLLYLVKAQSN